MPESAFDSDAMLMSNRKPKPMICFIRFACLPMIAFAVATNSCPMIGSTCTSLVASFEVADCCAFLVTGSICLHDYELSLAS